MSGRTSHLAETDYHTDRLYFLRGTCYLLCDKLFFSYREEDRYESRDNECSSDHSDYLCVPIADISYVQGQMLILSNGGAISLYNSPELDGDGTVGSGALPPIKGFRAQLHKARQERLAEAGYRYRGPADRSLFNAVSRESVTESAWMK